jgi:Na+/H+ antiporter NhaD/arsenite permease-like protein
VVFLLLGMMLIVAVVQRTGVFEYLAIWATKRARGRPFRLMASYAEHRANTRRGPRPWSRSR